MRVRAFWFPSSLIVAAGIASCTASPQPVRLLDVASAAISLEAIGSIEQLLLLEEKPETAFGTISAMRTDPGTGEILILDGDLTRTIYRFGTEGKLLSRFPIDEVSAQTPAPIADFVVLSTSDLVVAVGRQLILYDKTGSRRGAATVKQVPRYLAAMGTTTCAIMLSSAPERDLVHCFDETLKYVTSFHAYDERLSRYSYGPIAPIASFQGRFYVSDLYASAITSYNQTGDDAVAYVSDSSGEDSAFRGLWFDDQLTDVVRLQIRRQVRRFNRVYAVPGGLFLYDTQVSKEIRTPVLFDVGAATMTRFPAVEATLQVRQTAVPLWDFIVGEYENGLVLGIRRELLPSFAQHYPAALEVVPKSRFGPPLLAFFRTHAAAGSREALEGR